ncbi:MAG: CHASE2 domain-containing protein [Moraxellaceae bacterium]|nr:CHASE2 domain-containing protein [Moraxellaceae bacterium]
MRPPKGLTGHLSARWKLWMLGAGVLVSLLLGLASLCGGGIASRLDNLFLDAYTRLSAPGQALQRALVIDVDDVSLAAVGQWPWPRYRIAALIDGVAAVQPAAIGLDILFAEPDRTSLKNIQKAYKQDFGLDISVVGANGLHDNDGYLAEVLEKTGAVGARFFYFDHVSKAADPRPEFSFSGRTDLLKLHDAQGMLDNTPELASKMKFSGFLNTQADSDGILRRVPLLIQHAGVIYPHLSLATFMRAQGVAAARIEQDRHGPLIRVGEHAIPVDEKGFALLRLRGTPALYPSIPAVDVLNNGLAPEQVRGKMVFIGSSAAGLNDLHSTIFDAQFPGLRVQAALVDNFATGAFIRQPSWAGAALVAICLLVGLCVSGLFVVLRDPLRLCAGSVAIVSLVLGFSALAFISAGLFLSPAFPVLVAATLFVLFTTARFAMERQRANAWFRKLANAQQVAMVSMAAVAETRDPETGAHIKRTQHYVRAIAETLRDNGRHLDILTPEYIGLLFASAPLHDIGKVGVPDHILLKPGKLTEAEFVEMKKHAEYGRAIIHSAADRIEGENFLRIAAEIAYGHHEKWDGTGYPQGLAGEAIPLSARIMTVADVYDALISRRCYKEPFPHAQAMDMMRQQRGRIFDPDVLDTFFSIEERIVTIAATYRDEADGVLT